MNGTILYSGTLVVTSCWCGIKLAVPNDLYDIAQRNGTTAIYCPLGHTFIFGDAENARLKKEKVALERRLEGVRNSERAAWRQADIAWSEERRARRSAAAVRGHLTRMRNKIANGVCPVPNCRRHFDNVQDHLRGVHATWLEEHDIEIDKIA